MRGRESGQYWRHYSRNRDCSDNVNTNANGNNKDGNYTIGGNHGGVTGYHFTADSSGPFSGVCFY
ncbi:MAG: hypothetical protein ACYC5F_11045 [Thermoleophilia bacterium]